MILCSRVRTQAVADEETKPDLCDRIAKAAATYSPSRKWHIDTLIRVRPHNRCSLSTFHWQPSCDCVNWHVYVQVLAIAGSSDASGIAASVLILISQSPDLYSYVVHKLYSLIEEDTSQLPLVHVAVWCIGEYGEVSCSLQRSIQCVGVTFVCAAAPVGCADRG